MTRRFKSLVLDGVSHMIDDPAGDWVRWCDCREVIRLRSELEQLDVDRLTLAAECGDLRKELAEMTNRFADARYKLMEAYEIMVLRD